MENSTRSIKPVAALLIALSGSLFSGATWADSISDQINEGAKAYKAGDVKLAIEELKFAVAQLQEKLNSNNNTLMPKPLAGWKAEKVENNSGAMAMLGGGTQITRDYTKGDARVTIELSSSAMLSGAIAAMIKSPAMFGGGDVAPYRYQKYKGTINKDAKYPEISLLVGRQTLVKLSGNDVDKATLEKYLKAIDFKRVKSELDE